MFWKSFCFFISIFSFDYFVVWINAFNKFLSNHLHLEFIFGVCSGNESRGMCVWNGARKNAMWTNRKTKKSYTDNVQIIFGSNETKRAAGTNFQVKVKTVKCAFSSVLFLFLKQMQHTFYFLITGNGVVESSLFIYPHIIEWILLFSFLEMMSSFSHLIRSLVHSLLLS